LKIVFTDTAAAQIRETLGTEPGPFRLKLVYDAEGCGCAVNGLAQLWITDGPGPGDAEADGTPYRVFYEPRHEIFFDDAMTVDYLPAKRAYVLRSNQQIFNPMMSLTDKRQFIRN
jgi:uncharacterized protein YqkB